MLDGFIFQVRKLLESSEYNFRVAAENAVGTGRPIETSQPVLVKSPFDVPEAPQQLEVLEASHHAIVIEWLPPPYDGGAPIRGYIIERRQGYSSRFIHVGRGLVLDTYFKDTGVYDGSDYEYRVLAENEAGQSVPSRPVGPVVAKDPYGERNVFLTVIFIIYNNLIIYHIQ